MNGYQTKLLDAIRSGQIRTEPGTLQHATVLHDDDCALMNSGGECNCEPVIQPEGSR
jgi:hypothetical protein